MADSTASTSQPPSSPDQSGQPMSSQQYLQQLRARRENRQIPTETTSQPSDNLPPEQTPYSPSQPQSEPPQPPQQPTSDQPIESPNQGYAQSEIFPGQVKPLPEETVLEWKAPSRPFKKRNKQFYTTVGLITLLISLILFFAGQFLPIAVVISVAFLAYVLSSVPPETVTNKITTYGIRMDTVLLYWDELGRFWFEERYEQPMVVIETGRFPGRVSLLLNNIPKEQIEELLSEVLLHQKPKDTFIDKSSEWIQEKIPLDMG